MSGSRLAILLSSAALLFCGSAAAQVPFPSEPAEINACLCLQQVTAALASEKDAKTQTLASINRQLADLDARLAAERPRVEVNNPDSVARYKALLERRDAAYRQSLGPVQSDAAQSVARYNASVEEYNRRCAGRLFNSALLADIQARLNCPPFR